MADEFTHQSTRDPWCVCLDALVREWQGEATPQQVVGWMIAALDEAGDTQIPRTRNAVAGAEVMAAMVFADLGAEGIDYGAVVSNVLRAMREARDA
jgi:hypothetical protein